MKAILILSFLLLTSGSFADTVYLKNGRIVENATITGDDPLWISTNGTQLGISKSQIIRVDQSGKKSETEPLHLPKLLATPDPRIGLRQKDPLLERLVDCKSELQKSSGLQFSSYASAMGVAIALYQGDVVSYGIAHEAVTRLSSSAFLRILKQIEPITSDAIKELLTNPHGKIREHYIRIKNKADREEREKKLAESEKDLARKSRESAYSAFQLHQRDEYRARHKLLLEQFDQGNESNPFHPYDGFASNESGYSAPRGGNILNPSASNQRVTDLEERQTNVENYLRAKDDLEERDRRLKAMGISTY